MVSSTSPRLDSDTTNVSNSNLKLNITMAMVLVMYVLFLILVVFITITGVLVLKNIYPKKTNAPSNKHIVHGGKANPIYGLSYEQRF